MAMLETNLILWFFVLLICEDPFSVLVAATVLAILTFFLCYLI